MASGARDWFAVRCVFASGWPADLPPRYEERITIWQAADFEEAIQKAEAEAAEYAAGIEEAPDTYLGLAQAYKFDGPPTEGVEIFSLVRASDLPPMEYLTAFFDTGEEFQRTERVDG